MALTELQLPTKSEFYNKLKGVANQLNTAKKGWSDVADFIGNVTTADLDAMGVASGDVRVDLANFRTVLNEIVDLMGGEAVTPTNNPQTVINKIRSF